MIAYRAFGLVVGSSMVLPGMREVAAAAPDCVLALCRDPIRCRTAGPLRRIRLPDGRISLTVGRCGSRYLVRFPRLADFVVSGDGREIDCAPRRGTGARAVAHLFLAQVLPLALSRQGRLVLHASAVVTPWGAIGFLGAAGQGKSTLGASFVNESFPLLADDGLLLAEDGGALAGVPSYPEIRLWPDALAAFAGAGEARDAEHPPGKKRLLTDGGLWPFSHEQAPLRRLYVLGDLPPGTGSHATTIEALTGREAFLELVKHTYRLDFDDRVRLRSEFEAIGRIVSRAILYRLAVSRDLSRLPAVRAAILEHLAA